MKKRQRDIRLIRAGIQLAFFIAAPSLFSTAFAGIKSIFLAIAAGQPVEWNSFLTVTAALLIFTCFFGRHFCGYACAFGSFGDVIYEGFAWIWTKCFHKKKKPALSEKKVHRLQKVKYIVLALILLSCLTGVYGKLTGNQPVGCFFHAYSRKAYRQYISGGNHPFASDHGGNVHTGAFFLPVSLSDGSGFCTDANPARSTF